MNHCELLLALSITHWATAEEAPASALSFTQYTSSCTELPAIHQANEEFACCEQPKALRVGATSTHDVICMKLWSLWLRHTRLHRHANFTVWLACGRVCRVLELVPTAAAVPVGSVYLSGIASKQWTCWFS